MRAALASLPCKTLLRWVSQGRRAEGSCGTDEAAFALQSHWSKCCNLSLEAGKDWLVKPEQDHRIPQARGGRGSQEYKRGCYRPTARCEPVLLGVARKLRGNSRTPS